MDSKSSDQVSPIMQQLRQIMPPAFNKVGQINWQRLRQTLGDEIDNGERAKTNSTPRAQKQGVDAGVV